MKLQSRSQIEALAKFKSQGNLVTSLYLDTDKSRLNRKEIQLALKNLLNDARTRVCGLAAAKEKIECLLAGPRPHRRIRQPDAGVLERRRPGRFLVQPKEFWQALELPHGPRNRVIFDTNFYVRPLAAILDKYSPICVLLISRREARWYDVSMGEIKFLDEIQSDVPGRVREGGFEGPRRRGSSATSTPISRTISRRRPRRRSSSARSTPSTGSSSAARRTTSAISRPTSTAISATRSRPGCTPA